MNYVVYKIYVCKVILISVKFALVCNFPITKLQKADGLGSAMAVEFIVKGACTNHVDRILDNLTPSQYVDCRHFY